jgi:hypothetical protein
MASLTDLRGTACFIVSEAANIYRSREQVTVAAGAAPGLEPGTILGRLTADGNYVPLNTGASTGAEDVSGILFEGAIGTVERTVVVRDAEVNAHALIYPAGANDAAKATINAALDELGIIVRD